MFFLPTANNYYQIVLIRISEEGTSTHRKG